MPAEKKFDRSKNADCHQKRTDRSFMTILLPVKKTNHLNPLVYSLVANWGDSNYVAPMSEAGFNGFIFLETCES